MLSLPLEAGDEPLRVLCLGAHADDLEIGCGGTILKLTAGGRPISVTWVVWSGEGPREQEARESAEIFLERAKSREVIVHGFRDGFFPSQSAAIKESFEALKQRGPVDLIFTHYRGDMHQDHRLISDLTWNTFRHHMILEYEIPKYDGDFGSPNVFVELDADLARRKAETIMRAFRTQAGRQWFSEDLFLSVLRIRGMECAAASRYAEAFYGRKVVLGLGR
jgi:LmbE family N-acetylglucosaminyl deacetylase